MVSKNRTTAGLVCRINKVSVSFQSPTTYFNAPPSLSQSCTKSQTLKSKENQSAWKEVRDRESGGNWWKHRRTISHLVTAALFSWLLKKKIIISFNRPVLLCREQVKGKKLSSVENRTLSREHDQKRNKDREHDSFYPLYELVYK